MDNLRDIRGLVISVIKEELKFWKHYIGEVKSNDDSLNLGRVQVTVPELGFFSEDQAIWAFPRQGNSISIPQKGEWVEIYFIGGDSDRPVYLHYASEVQGSIPENYSSPATRVLFESPKTGEYILYNDDDKKLIVQLTENEITINGDSTVTIGGNVTIDISGTLDITSATAVNLLTAVEAFVKGTTHQTALTALCTALSVIVPAGSSAANIAAIQAAFATFNGTLSNMLSTKIKGE